MDSKTSIETMDKAAAKVIGDAALEALREVAERYGLTVKPQRGTYNPEAGTFTFKAEFGAGDTERTKFESEVKHLWLDDPSDPTGMRMALVLDASDYRREFSVPGNRQRYRLVALNLRAPKWPLIVEGVTDGKRVKFQGGVARFIVQARGEVA